MPAHNGGRSWADHRARQAVQERADQAAKLDEGLFRGAPDRPMASALEGTGGVRALVVGGCCELNTTAHELLVDIGSEVGAYNAAESGESLAECIALDIRRVRQFGNCWRCRFGASFPQIDLRENASLPAALTKGPMDQAALRSALEARGQEPCQLDTGHAGANQGR